MEAKIDSDGNGRRDDATDAEIRYCYGVTGCNNPSPSANTLYYNNNTLGVFQPEILSRHVRSLDASRVGNCVNINLTLCDNPAQTCGTLTNPQLNMEVSVKMPSVSAQ